LALLLADMTAVEPGIQGSPGQPWRMPAPSSIGGLADSILTAGNLPTQEAGVKSLDTFRFLSLHIHLKSELLRFRFILCA
jgi:hypothetical protein